MRFSFCLDTRRPWAHLRRIAELADRQDWYAVYVSDHFMPYAPGPADGTVLEAWTTLSALGAATARVRVGSLVLGGTYRHPAVVANMAATLQRVTGGRVVLGLGAGWQPNEHRAYGIDLPPVGPRMDRFEESCRVVAALLRDRRVTVDGTHFRLADAPGLAPEPTPPPILVGGAGERRTLRIAATYADVWHAWATPPEVRRLSGLLDRHCTQAGRDPANVLRATGQVVRLTPAAEAGDSDGDGDLVGTVDQVTAALHEYARAGVTEFIVRDHAALGVDATLDTMATLTAAVIPRLV